MYVPWQHALVQALVALIVAGVVALIGLRKGSTAPALLIVGAVFLTGLEQVLTGTGGTIPREGPGPNWIGKIASAAAMAGVLGFMLARGWKRSTLGLAMPARGSIRPALIAIALLVLARALLAWRFGSPQQLSLETLAFNLTLPGIEEELFARGALLAILIILAGAEPVHAGAPTRRGWLAVVAAAVVFASLHALAPRLPIPGTERGLALWGGWELVFEPGLFARTLATGVLYGWLRLRTGSVLVPIVAHNAANFSGTLVPMLLKHAG